MGQRASAADCGVTTESLAARRALDASVQAILGHRADAMARLQEALAADAGLVIGHALAGLQQRVMARQEATVQAAASLAAARVALLARGGTPREHAFVAALAAWQDGGDMDAAAGILEAQLLRQPCDAAALKLSHAIRFMLGDPVGMRLAIERALPAWSADMPGFGFVLGCHAFALEETGAAEAAEHVGRRAVALQPDDLWGAHAVAHVLESQGRAREGLGWIAARASTLPGAGSFARHIFWHRALFHLHLGEGDAALALYDGRIRDEPSEDVRDVANAASLLWRLEAQRVPVGAARWDELADIAEGRIGDHSLAFADLHHVLSLAAAGRKDALAAFLAGMRDRALRDTDTQARVFSAVGLTTGQGIAAAVAGDSGRGADLLGALRGRLQAVGGSHAQRDLIERIALDAALAAGRHDSAAAMLRNRARRRAPGAWEAACARRLGVALQSRVPEASLPGHALTAAAPG